MHAPRLFSIPPGAAFLPCFVRALVEGRLVDGFDAQDPLALAQTTIYVPTRRAARALRSVFVEMSTAAATFLPVIRPLGDADDDCLLFSAADGDGLPPAPPIADSERLLLLARLIRPWRERLPAHIRSLFGHEDITIPASTADAIWLARDLSRLMDEIETEEADWSRLKEIAPDMVAEWWQVTLDFLEIVTTSWPQILKERGLASPAAWRSQAIRRAAARLAASPPAGPVLAAGSTGSIPAAAELVRTIAFLPRGAVILPGIDRDLDEASWQMLDETERDPAMFAHPQYSLKKLLRTLGATRSSVEHLGAVCAAKRQRERLVSEAFRPAATTDAWSSLEHKQAGDAFCNAALVEAPGEREEALAIAVALRAAIEEKGKTAALVTGERNLARRVCAELNRFGIHADDSSGSPLSESEPATLIRLLLTCIFEPGDPVALLSLLKHPLVHLGHKRAFLRGRAEQFELFALRGGTGRIALGTAEQFIAERLQKLTDGDNQGSANIHADMIADAALLGQQLTAASAPLHAFSRLDGPVTVAQAVTATGKSFENFGRDENNSLTQLYAREAGQAMMQFLRALVADQSGLEFSAREWPQIFAALLAAQTVQRPYGCHPRLMIWGALEARLQTVDTMVIGGLNEGSWPAAARNDPFMSRTMKTAVALEPPERRTGLAAHDFQMALGMEHVILTRSLRLDNAPAVASRWLQRLETVLGPREAAAMRGRGQIYLDWAQKLDAAPDRPFITRPCPAPPAGSRPRHFSVTEIETLRRDPYATYARKILRLKPLDSLLRDPSAAERGILYHNIAAAFTASGTAAGDRKAQDLLLQIARAEFDRLHLPPDVTALWWPCFLILAPRLLQWEASLGQRTRLAEIAAKPVAINSTGVTLSGRADRIDLVGGDRADILDFKTGATPSIMQAAKLMAPQLALEGALLNRGAFADCGAKTPADLLYIRLTARGEVEPQSILKAAGKTAAELAQEAWRQLDALISHYHNPATGYLSRALPPMVDYEGDYDHLARVWEWSAGAAGEEE